ncbi:MAG TPA: helix-turn-helix transcriptional regulator [Hyphomonas sp.]|nr:helix-turn-helix transcriptional regulator [Hyphomonas sp.]HRJ47240.1 helix-turn-helix transcriptional regulator [Opitutaceae bacterium]
MPVKDPTLRKFGDNVRARREALDLSQEQLAERAELDRTYISGVERGVRNLSLNSVVRIAKALKTSASELCEGIS